MDAESMKTYFNFAHFWNAPFPMLVTVLGINTLISELLFANAPAAIAVTVVPLLRFVGMEI